MQSKFFRNLVFLLLLNLLIKPIWIFGIDRVVQNTVGTEAYGLFYTFFNLGFLFNILLDAGLANYTTRQFAQFPEKAASTFSSLISLRTLLSFVYLILIGLAGVFLGYNFGQLKMLLMVGVIHVFISTVAFLRAALSGLMLFKQQSFISVLDKSILIILIGAILFTNVTQIQLTINGFIAFQILAYITSSIIALYIIVNHLKQFSFKLNLNEFKQLLKLGAPFALLSIFMAVYHRVDSVMIERMMNNGAYQAGIYAQSYRILDALNIFGYLFATLLLPIFSKQIAKNQTVTAMVSLGVRLMIVPALTIATIAIYFANDIITLLYTDVKEESFSVFTILICGFVPMATNYIFGTLLTAAGKLKLLNKIAAITMLLNVALNFFLIPIYGIYGAAMASLFCQSISAVFQLINCNSINGLSLLKLPITKTLVVFAVSLLAAFMANSNGLSLMNSILIIVLCTITAVFTLRLFKIYEIRSLLQGSNLE